MTVLVVVGVVLCIVAAISSAPQEQPSIVWESVEVDWNWPGGAQEKAEAVASGRYIVANNVVTGVKYYKGNYFLTVPRWLSGVPSTMNVYNPDEDQSSTYLLNAWPSFAMNTVDDCSAFQYVQSMEIDSEGRMWIIDVGSVDIFESGGAGRRNVCPPKLVIIDIDSKEILHKHIFSPDVASWTFNFLNDIVLDQKEGFAYISDTLGYNNTGGIITYNYNTDTSRRLTDNSTQIQWSDRGNIFHINGRSYNMMSPSDTIALDGDGKTLFYGALSGFDMYEIPTSVLRSFNLTDEEVASHIKKAFRRPSQCDGMTSASSPGVFFYGTHDGPDSLVRTTLAGDGSATTVTLYSNNDTMQWVDTLAWKGAEETLIFSTNRLQRFFLQNPPLSSNESNFRVFELSTPGFGSYLTNPTYQQPPLKVRQQGDCPSTTNWKDAGEHSDWERATVKGLVAVMSIVGGGFFCILLYVACSSRVAALSRAEGASPASKKSKKSSVAEPAKKAASTSAPLADSPVSSPIHNSL